MNAWINEWVSEWEGSWVFDWLTDWLTGRLTEYVAVFERVFGVSVWVYVRVVLYGFMFLTWTKTCMHLTQAPLSETYNSLQVSRSRNQGSPLHSLTYLRMQSLDHLPTLHSFTHSLTDSYLYIQTQVTVFSQMVCTCCSACAMIFVDGYGYTQNDDFKDYGEGGWYDGVGQCMTCVCICICLYEHKKVLLRACICLCAYICVYVYIYIPVCVYVCSLCEGEDVCECLFVWGWIIICI